MRLSLSLYLSLLLFLVGSFFLLGLVGSTRQREQVRRFYDEVINALEDSDGAPEVRQTLEREAARRGYRLTLTPLGTSAGKSAFYVQLEYSLNWNVLGNISYNRGEISGYAG